MSERRDALVEALAEVSIMCDSRGLDPEDAETIADALMPLLADWAAEERLASAAVKVEREHRWFEYGRWFYGFGSSMDPHRCGDPGTVCEWRERTVSFEPWPEWAERARGEST